MKLLPGDMYTTTIKSSTSFVLVFFLLFALTQFSHAITWQDEDSIIIEAPKGLQESEGIRWKSQRQFPGFPPGWPGGQAGSWPGGIFNPGSIFGQRPPFQLPGAIGIGGIGGIGGGIGGGGIGGGTGQCHTREGEEGTCVSFRQCYPILYTPESNFEQVGNSALADVYMESSVLCNRSEIAAGTGMLHNHLYRDSNTRQTFPKVCCGQVSKPPASIIKVTTQAPSWPWTLRTTSWTSTTTPRTTTWPSWRPGMGGGGGSIGGIGGPGGNRPPSSPPTMRTTTTTRAPVITSNCGTPRVIGGTVATPGSYPWQVALIHNNRFFCGGSLIDNVHVLTAAHCFQTFTSRDLPLMKVILGDHDLSRRDEAVHIVRNIQTLIKHKGFNRIMLRDDIALLKLDMTVPFSDTIMPICLTSGSRVDDGMHEAIMAGWGSIRYNGPTESVLRHVTMRVWTNQECQIKYGSQAPYGISDKQICAASPARDACQGDSGGALFRRQNKNSPYEQIGIVSWGIGCGVLPGIYSRVSAYLDWIAKNRGR